MVKFKIEKENDLIESEKIQMNITWIYQYILILSLINLIKLKFGKNIMMSRP